MKKHSLTVSCAAAAALVMGSAAVFAAGLPPERQSGGATYVTGGVSDEESSLFKQARMDYPLSIELVQKAGSLKYADVQKALANGSFNTVIGKLEFDAKGDPKNPAFVVYQWKGNQYDVVVK